VESKVTEDDLAEQDLIVIPGQGRLKRTGFVPNDSKGNILDKDLSSIDPDDQGEEEGSFVKNQIHTMLRVLKHLEHAIGDEEDLPEWVQMKISQAQQSVVGVMDYMISDKEREVERHTGHASLMKENNNQRVDSLVTDALRVMKGPEISDAVLALKRVLGDRAYNERRGFYSFYIDQIHDMYNQQNINELSSGLLGRAAQAATDKRNQAMEPKLHDALGGGYMNPLAKHYDNVSQKMDNRAAQVKRKETIQNIASRIASPAVMRKMGMSGVAEAEHNFKGANGPVSVTTTPGGTVVKRKSWDSGAGGSPGDRTEFRDPNSEYFNRTRNSDYDSGDYSNDPESSADWPFQELNELSNEKLAQYKTAAAADAGQSDLASNYKRADKRFSGIIKATKKQFANDLKKYQP
jgi:hypothetical protein